MAIKEEVRMKFNPQKHHRRSIRLPGYDYSQPGAYFITMVTQRRECLFGEILNGEIKLNDTGRTVWEVWNSLPARYPQIRLGTAQVMPNHFHGIIVIPVRAIHELPLQGLPLPGSPLPGLPMPSPQVTDQMQRRRMTIPLVVGYFKMNTAKRINKILGSEGVSVWQRNYYEHIIRNDEEYNRIHLYIETNVANWVMDNENPMK
jgi:REP element-mobilizing transposase RayT